MRTFLLLIYLVWCGLLTAQDIGTPDAPAYRRQVPAIDTTAAVSGVVSESPLYRRHLTIIGDSYVANHRDKTEHGWSYLLAEKYQMQYDNYGKNGNCIVFDRPRWGRPMLDRYVELPEQTDYLIIVAGHNDADYIRTQDLPDSVLTQMSEVERRQMRDSLTAVFRTGLATFIDRLIVRYPDTKIALITPWNVDREGFPQMLAALREICAQKSLPLYDAAAQSGIYVNNPEFRRRYFQGANDTAHLNAAGHRLFLNKMESFIRSL